MSRKKIVIQAVLILQTTSLASPSWITALWWRGLCSSVKLEPCRAGPPRWTSYSGESIKRQKQRHHFAYKSLYCQSYGFSSSHIWKWELDHKESWVSKNWCLRTVVLEKTLESPLDCKEIQPVNAKGNQPWIFIGRTDAEAPIFWPPGAKSRLFGKETDPGKDWGPQGEGVIEDEMVGWHHRLNGLDFEQTLGDREGQGNVACCSPWVAKCRTWPNYWTRTTSRVFLNLTEYNIQSTNPSQLGYTGRSWWYCFSSLYPWHWPTIWHLVNTQ